MSNNSEILSIPVILGDLTKSTINEDELFLKLKQIKEVTNCNEEQGILILHDCNYNVEYAINKILTIDSKNDTEWKTKKSRQKKVQLKSKETEKIDLNNNVKDKKKSTPPNESLSIKQISQEAYNNGRTFRNFNLSKKDFSRYIINASINTQFNTTIMNFNNKWDGKSVIIENRDFAPMDYLTTITEVKEKSTENLTIIPTEVVNKEDINSLSSMFKTHCSTKPPPKVQYSLESPVQIMHKNVSNRTLPKLKFGDTDFTENSKNILLDSTLHVIPSNNNHMNESFINVEDNSIIKVGPSQKLNNFPVHQEVFNQNIFYPQNDIKQCPSILNNVKNIEYPKNNNTESMYENYGYQLPIGNPVSCNAGFQPLGNYVPAHMNNIKDITNHSKPHDIFFNQPQINSFSSQSNVNHPKSTIYLVPNMLMQNSMNSLYMTVPNPLPASALSPPVAQMPSQYNIATELQHNPMYFDESLANDDTLLRITRPFNQNRQPTINRTRKPYRDVQEESVMKNDILKGNYKGLQNFPLNQNPLPKQVPMNYSLYIAPGHVASQNRPQLMPSALNHFTNNLQEINAFDRKRNMPMAGGNHFNGKPWS